MDLLQVPIHLTEIFDLLREYLNNWEPSFFGGFKLCKTGPNENRKIIKGGFHNFKVFFL